MLGQAEQGIEFGLGQHDRQQADLEAVVEEYIGERFGQDGAETEILQGPGRMLARRAAAKIGAREEYRGALIARLVEHEIRIRRAP
jgi:hypothetical protein